MRPGAALPPAERLLRSLGVTEPRDIDLELVAWERRVEVVYRPLKGAEAHIQGRGSTAVITVNSLSSYKRQRYSLAHELGHWHHHRGQRLFFCRGEEAPARHRGETDPERTADAYAADLLMPSFLFVPMTERARAADLGGVRELARSFGTSQTATAIRFVERGPFPAMVAWHDRTGRMVWSRPSRLLPPGLRPRPLLHQDTFAFDALYGGRSRVQASATRADAWFPGPRLAAFRVTESSAPVNEGVLTMLWFRDANLLDALR